MAAVLGIDIGGSGIKANLVDPLTGSLIAERFRIDTPVPSHPAAVTAVVAKMVSHFEYVGPVGCTFPAVVKDGLTLTAANVDPGWINFPAAHAFGEATGQRVVVVNDADAAGVAEVAFGAGRGQSGVVMILTLGTGIGSAVFLDGKLIPNTEFGHLQFAGHQPVEDWAAASVRENEGLGWEEWALRVDAFLNHLHLVMAPDLIVLGGGVSRRWGKWSSYLTVPVEVVPATLRNEAGIVGAALMASATLPN